MFYHVVQYILSLWKKIQSDYQVYRRKTTLHDFLQMYKFDLVSWYLIDFGTRDTLYISIPLGTGDCQWTVCQCGVCGLEAVPDCRGPAPALTHTDWAAGDPAALQGHGPKVHWLCDQGTVWSGKYLGIKIFRLLSSQELHRLWDICSIYNMIFHSTYMYGIIIMYQDLITYPVKFKTKYYCQGHDHFLSSLTYFTQTS